MIDDMVSYLGIISSVIIALMFLPQLYHVYSNKDTNALSYSFLCLNLTASLSGMVYAIYYNVLPMAIANVSAGVFSSILILFKYRNELICTH